MAEPARLPRLIAFTDSSRVDVALLLERWGALAERAAPGSVVLCLRDYGESARTRYALGERLAALCVRTAQQLGIADRAELGRALGATWLHLPEAGVSARDARRYVAPGVRLSRACHDPTQSAEPELDARLLSPIVAARKGRQALGLGALSASPLPVYALGGIEPELAGACLAAGAAGVAVIGAALAPDPRPLLDALRILRD